MCTLWSNQVRSFALSPTHYKSLAGCYALVYRVQHRLQCIMDCEWGSMSHSPQKTGSNSVPSKQCLFTVAVPSMTSSLMGTHLCLSAFPRNRSSVPALHHPRVYSRESRAEWQLLTVGPLALVCFGVR